jgi:hypothetical protein
MTGFWYLIFAYAISIALLWGYAISLWVAGRKLQTRSAQAPARRQ